MAVWYYSIDGAQSGPCEEAQVKALVGNGKIKASDLVWKEGTADWVPAGTVAELRPASRLAPLPVAPIPVGAPVIAAAPVPGQPIQLAYAAPTDVAIPVIGHDEGPFLKLGKIFSVPGGRWTGMAIVSPRAVYLMKVSKARSSAAYGVGGLAGILIAQAFSKADDVRTCSMTDLPHPVRTALDPKGKRSKCDAIVLPRDAVSRVKKGSMNNLIAFHLGADRFGITTGLFSGGKIKRFMTESGWVLNHDLTPTADPIHGVGLGREFHEMGKRGPGAAKRVIYAIVGVLLFILVVYLRTLRHY
jgi:hypothetical protein